MSVWQNLPVGLVFTGCIAFIGLSQYGVHYAYHGQQKQVMRDAWDYQMEKRDKLLYSTNK